MRFTIIRTAFAALTLASAAVPAVAGESGPPGASSQEWRVSAGPGFLVGPRYLGASTYRVLPIPALEISYANLFLNGRDGLGITLVDSNGLRAGASAFVRFGRRSSDDPSRLSGLPNIDVAPQARLFAEQTWERFKLRAMISHDIGEGDGTTLDLDASVSARVGDRYRVSIGPRVSFGDRNFNQTYFGIAPAAATPARRAYAAGTGLYQAGVGGQIFAPLGGRWSLIAIAGVDRLTGAAARSPVVGSKTQASGGAFLAYAF